MPIIPRQCCAVGLAGLLGVSLLFADDWPMFGRDQTRNPVSPEKGAPVEWDLKTGRNIKWRVRLGTSPMAQPIVSGGLIWIWTNDDGRQDPSRNSAASVLACFRERDGVPLYQQRFQTTNEWFNRRAVNGLKGSPFAEGNRLWFASPLAEIVCLDTSMLRRAEGNPRTLWQIDMISQLGVFPATDMMGGKGVSSLGATWGDMIYVITGNGRDQTRYTIPAPQAPALVCVNKTTGKVLWQDNSPGTNILYGELGSPLAAELGGVAQVIAPQGDGWARAFEAGTGKLLWKFDINPKANRRGRLPSWQPRLQDRNFFLNAPVLAGGRIFLIGGRNTEEGEGPGRLVCVDPTRRGDLSLELDGERNEPVPNPNAGAVWHFDQIHWTHGNVAVARGLVIAADYSGYVYCLDAMTGQMLWKHDQKGHIWGAPLVVDDKVYVGNEDGEVSVFELSREKRVLFTTNVEAVLRAPPIFANGVLYIATDDELFAFQQGASSPPPTKPSQP